MPRRFTAAVVCLLAPVLAAAAGAPAAAVQATPTSEPTGSPAAEQIEVPEPVPGEEQCRVQDNRLPHLSGLVARDNGYVMINSATQVVEQLPIYFLDEACTVVDQQGFYPGRPRDPEDLALDRAEDVLWVADVGDDGADDSAMAPREAVALWRVDLAGADRTPVIHRFVYPDGEARNAEALLLDGDGMPVLVTKEVGTAELYRPTELVANNPAAQAVPLEKVGEFTPPDTGSPHPRLPSQVARQVVTGAAHHPDGDRVVVRTYTDAFEFEVTDGDVVSAITSGEPVVTPLPDEPQGEAITYTADGEQFVTVSEVPEDEEFSPTVLTYTPADPPEPEPPPEDTTADGSGDGGGSWFNSVQDILNLAAAVGVLGLALVVTGIVGIVRGRRRWAAARAQRRDARGSKAGARETAGARDGEDDRDVPEGRARAAAGSAAVGGASAGSAAAGGGVYTSTGYGGAAPEQEGYPGDWSGDRDGPGRAARPERGGTYSGGAYAAGGGAARESAGRSRPGTYSSGTYSGGTYSSGGYAGGHPGGPPPDEPHHPGGPTYQQGHPQQPARPQQPAGPHQPARPQPQGSPHPQGSPQPHGRPGPQGHPQPQGTYAPGEHHPGYTHEDPRQAAPQPHPGHGTYAGGYAAGYGEDPYADDYYDDPDYRYEFRDR